MSRPKVLHEFGHEADGGKWTLEEAEDLESVRLLYRGDLERLDLTGLALAAEILRLSAENKELRRLLREVEEGGCLDAGEQCMEPEDAKEIRAIAWECRDEETDDD